MVDELCEGLTTTVPVVLLNAPTTPASAVTGTADGIKCSYDEINNSPLRNPVGAPSNALGLDRASCPVKKPLRSCAATAPSVWSEPR